MSSATSAPPQPLASLYPDHFQDSFSSFPTRALSYGHALREATHSLLPGVVKFSLTGLTVGYIGYSSTSRGVQAGRLERHPELARKSMVSATMDSALTLWLECITLPGILTGLTHRLLAARLPPTTSPTLLRLAPPLVAALALPPILLPLCAHAGEAMMAWSFRPALLYFAQPSDKVFLGSPQYVLPLEEDVGALQRPQDLLSLVPSDFDEEDTLRLKWALDGDVNSIYPEGPSATGAAAGAAGKGKGGAVEPSSKGSSSGSNSSSSVGGGSEPPKALK